MTAGVSDIDRAVRALSERIPEPLAPLAQAAYNYRWSWMPGGDSLFATIDPDRWERVLHNPVALLVGAPLDRLRAVAQDKRFVADATELAARIAADGARPPRD